MLAWNRPLALKFQDGGNGQLSETAEASHPKVIKYRSLSIQVPLIRIIQS